MERPGRNIGRILLIVGLPAGMVLFLLLWLHEDLASSFARAQKENGYVLVSTDGYKYYLHDRRKAKPRLWFEIEETALRGRGYPYASPFTEWPGRGHLCYTGFGSIRMRTLGSDADEKLVPNCNPSSLMQQPADDGSLYFVGSHDGENGLFRVDRADMSVSMVTNLGDLSIWGFDVSPDGSAVFADMEDKVILVKPGEEVETYTIGEGQFPRFSPNGRLVAYGWWRGQEEAVFLTEVTPPFKSRRFVAGVKPEWSPDGSMLFVEFGNGSAARIVTMEGEIQAESFVPLGQTFASGNVVWSPDSRFVVFTRPDPAALKAVPPQVRESIMVMEAESGEMTELWDCSKNEDLWPGARISLGFLHTGEGRH